jgi:hypothetical protein
VDGKRTDLDQSDNSQSLFVWLIVAAMAAFMLVCIATAGRNVPLAEDWLLVPAYYGVEPDLPRWLWAQNNEHRVPLPKLLLLGLLHLTSGDFRAGMVASVVVLAAASSALIWAARTVRGGPVVWTDAVFPLLLLHPGNWENLVWSWQLQFTISVALSLLLLVSVIQIGKREAALWPLVAAVAFIALPLSGANGLVVCLAMAPWGLYVGIVAPGVAAERRPVSYLLLTIAACLGVILTGAYFLGYERPAWVPSSPGLWQSVTTAGKVAALAWGPAGLAFWPPFAILTTLIAGSAGGLLLAGAWRAWRARDTQLRATALGLAGFLGAIGLLLLLIGHARAGYAPLMPDRYQLFSVPALCAAYLVWELYGRRAVRSAQAALLVAVIVALPVNASRGFSWRAWYVHGMEAVEADIAAGKTPDDLAQRHRVFLLHWNQDLLAQDIKLLRDHRHPSFRPAVPAARASAP